MCCKACERGLDLMIVSSLCRIHSESLHGFCHFHLNCSSHWWWLLFHLHNLPEACPTIASFFIDSCPMGIICINSKFTSVSGKRYKPIYINEDWLTFLPWSTNAADSLIELLATPGVNLSCFGIGTDIGYKGPFISSVYCLNDSGEFSCWCRVN